MLAATNAALLDRSEPVTADPHTLPDESQAAIDQAWSVEIRGRLADVVDGSVVWIPGEQVFANIQERLAAKWS